ncbi:MAG: amidohydrolase [Novosphingobium sp.]|jgi:predicted amidohydrolase YtcJ|uniref:amidohydrolase n=1 Tax=Novosphingobium sp. TaxID=1874826 RepID=UPI00391920B3
MAGFDRRSAMLGLAALPLIGAAPTVPGARRQVTVFEAARFITMDPALPEARFVAVADGMILGHAHTLDALAPWTRGQDVTLNHEFAGKVLVPGLIDPHVHPMLAAVMLNLPFIAPDDWILPSGRYPGAQSPQAWHDRLKAELARSQADPFICWGYHQLFHGALDRRALDAIAPDRAVVIWQRSFHDVIANSAALKAWGLGDAASFAAALAAAKADPRDSDFDKGLFSETGLPVALAKMQPALLGGTKVRDGMAALQRMMLTSGVTTVSDMGTGIFADFATEAGLIRAAFERRGNPSRIMLMPLAHQVPADADLSAYLTGIESRFAGHHVRVDRRVKLLADGAFFALNMRMNAPGYTDGHSGKWITPPDALDALAQRFWRAGYSLHIHVNGDEGLDVTLATTGRLEKRAGQTLTLEHLGYSTEEQNRRIAQQGLMVSAQPNYIRVLGDAYALEGLGPDRAATINRLGSLERKGVPLGLHSDFNMAPINPLYLAWIAANRLTLAGHRQAPYERLSLDKALRAITIEAAQVIGMDHLVGSIRAGKRADFTILSRDPYKAGAARLNEVQVEGVIFEGSVTRI